MSRCDCGERLRRHSRRRRKQPLRLVRPASHRRRQRELRKGAERPRPRQSRTAQAPATQSSPARPASRARAAVARPRRRHRARSSASAATAGAEPVLLTVAAAAGPPSSPPPPPPLRHCRLAQEVRLLQSRARTTQWQGRPTGKLRVLRQPRCAGAARCASGEVRAAQHQEDALPRGWVPGVRQCQAAERPRHSRVPSPTCRGSARNSQRLRQAHSRQRLRRLRRLARGRVAAPRRPPAGARSQRGAG